MVVLMVVVMLLLVVVMMAAAMTVGNATGVQKWGRCVWEVSGPQDHLLTALLPRTSISRSGVLVCWLVA